MVKKFMLMTVALLALLSSEAYALNNKNWVADWGKLKLVNNQLCSDSGTPVQLRGWSTHGKNWQGGCFDDKADYELMKEKGANVARIAMYLKEGGYEDINWIKQCIEWTNSLGMYCIVDWHMLTPGNPNASDYSGAENFFRSLSRWVTDNSYKNVLYEICNEPNIDEDGDLFASSPSVWEWVKKYSEKILPAIAEYDKDAVVIIGTPQWCKVPEYALIDPISDTQGLNVMYSFHYYAGSDEAYLGKLSAVAAFMPVFVSEWGVSSSDGGSDGQVFMGAADKLIKVCNGKNLGGQIISWCNWSWSAESRSSSAFSSYPNTMRESGQYVSSLLGTDESRIDYCNSIPYGNQPLVLTGTEDFYLPLDCYDNGGHDEAYYDYDLPSWGGTGNLGEAGKDGIRSSGSVDLGYTDDSNKQGCYRSLCYITGGEWVTYTIDVKNAGDYEFEVLTNNHSDYNIIGISVDGQNALVSGSDSEATDILRGVQLPPSNGGTTEGGYSDWGWKVPVPYSEASSVWRKLSDFHIRFNESGVHKLGIAFLTSNSGIGSLKMNAIIHTGISSVATDKQETWHNIYGMRIDKPSKPGLYIKNGMKVRLD